MEKPDPQRFSTEADFLFAWREWEHEQEEIPHEIFKEKAIKNSDLEYIESDWQEYKKSNEYRVIIAAMHEFASLKEQEARTQAQTGINKAMDRLKFADKSLVKHPDCYNDERIKMALDFISTAFHELEKLKK